MSHKVTLVAFVYFFPIMYLHMFPHVNFIKACVDTLTAFVRPDFTMCFHMCPQIACLR